MGCADAGQGSCSDDCDSNRVCGWASDWRCVIQHKGGKVGPEVGQERGERWTGVKDMLGICDVPVLCMLVHNHTPSLCGACMHQTCMHNHTPSLCGACMHQTCMHNHTPSLCGACMHQTCMHNHTPSLFFKTELLASAVTSLPHRRVCCCDWWYCPSPVPRPCCLCPPGALLCEPGLLPARAFGL